MKHFLPLVALLVCGLSGAAPKATVPPEEQYVAGIVIVLDGVPQGVILIGDHGHYDAVQAQDCADSDACIALIQKLKAAGGLHNLRLARNESQT